MPALTAKKPKPERKSKAKPVPSGPTLGQRLLEGLGEVAAHLRGEETDTLGYSIPAGATAAQVGAARRAAEKKLRERQTARRARLAVCSLAPHADARVAFTTDSYVVRPIFFPGGDIGSLAVHGTVNDLAVMGATPRWLSAAFVLEEGLSIAELRGIVADMAARALDAGVRIVAGDTKVVERGAADGCYITTTGVGTRSASVHLGAEHVRSGDRVIVSGNLGDHGMAVLLARGEFALGADIVSDCAPLHQLAAWLMRAAHTCAGCVTQPAAGWRAL